MKFGHTLKEAIEQFSNLQSRGLKGRGDQLPWLRYKSAKKALELTTSESGEEFFAILATNLDEIDAEFRQLAEQILQSNQLPKALAFLRAEKPIPIKQRHVAWMDVPSAKAVAWMQTAKAVVTCQGLSPQAARSRAENALYLAAWAELNAVAVRKIMKKFNKRQSSHRESSIDFVQEQYRTRAFMQGPLIVELKCCCRLVEPLMHQPRLAPVASSPFLEEVPLSCPVCFVVFLKPVGLPCGHCLCRLCYDNFISKAAKGASDGCPVCRLPRGEAEPVRMRHLSALARTELQDEWILAKKVSKDEALALQLQRERELEALPAGARLMVSALNTT